MEEQDRYEELVREIDVKLDEHRSKSITKQKRQKLTKAGYDEEQVNRYVDFIVGDTKEEIEESIDKLRNDLPPNRYYGDPSLGNDAKSRPVPKDPEEFGREMYAKLKKEGKIR